MNMPKLFIFVLKRENHELPRAITIIVPAFNRAKAYRKMRDLVNEKKLGMYNEWQFFEYPVMKFVWECLTGKAVYV